MRKLLHEHPHVVTESHLADFSTGNGKAGGECGEVDGAPAAATPPDRPIKDAVVRMNLEQMGYVDDAEDATQAHLKAAIEAGKVKMLDFRTARLIDDPAAGTRLFDAILGEDPCADVVVAFFLYDTRISNRIATWTRGDGSEPVVDAFASDGGAAPRNVSCRQAFALYWAGALSGPMMAAKLSYNPARMLGLVDKGHLSVGADADLTLLDAATGEPAMSFTRGEMIMARGIPVPVRRRPTMIITADGKTAMCPEGGTEPCLRYRVVDLGKDSRLYSDGSP